MVDPKEATGGAQRALAPGTRIEVRRRYDQRWTRGFEVAGFDGDRYVVRRLSDGTLLPASFTRTDLRRERHETWWF
ncbi:MAG: hypothetical protein AVDCRST_MAG76-3110 [uncultured Acidimicrobiales bacterium]|uniref:Uncharacterized protein n=1 Tax=uncultured Acidimicrobiales bacterium TaxID=310071 RepID=A0A6J4J2J6_9ACTN|nr:MAG: hypothetical protein AVDCRST_MAG76-3110 [uncultured Acidimicrobiales bacterium]